MTYALVALAGFIVGTLFGILLLDWYVKREQERALRAMYERISSDIAKVHPLTIAEARERINKSAGIVVPIRDLDDSA
jgi:hypothetical protein